MFAIEPTTDSPLFALDRVVVTPHLGASTKEAQDKAGTTVAEMVRLALTGEFVPYAVNVSAGAEVTEVVRPFVPLAERLGALTAGLAEGGVRSIVASYLGRIAESDTRVLTLAILKGILGRTVHEPVSFVNAPMLARERGLTVSEMRSTVSQDYVSSISLRAETDDEPVDRVGIGARPRPRARHAGQRLRDRGDARRAHGVLHLRRPARASSARSARCSASTASTSPRWTSAARPRAARP